MKGQRTKHNRPHSELYREFERRILTELLTQNYNIDSSGFLDSYNWRAPKVIIKDRKKFGIYGKAEKLTLRCLYDVLYPVMEKRLSANCIGGRRGYGFGRWLDWLNEARRKKLYWVLKTDIKDFFSCINHQILDKILKDKFRLPNDLRKLLFLLLSLGVGESEPKGILCGNPLGKLLSNAYLSILDELLLKKKVLFVRFIDDICVFVKSKSQAETLLEEIREFCRNELEVELSTDKTGIYHLFFNRFEFLGFEVVGNYVRPSKANIERFIKKIKELPNIYCKAGIKKFLKKINSLVYHFAHLYKIGSVRKLFMKLDEVVRESFRKYIRLSGKDSLLATSYSNPEKFPVNLAFSTRSLMNIGLASLYEIKLSWDARLNGGHYDHEKEKHKMVISKYQGGENSKKPNENTALVYLAEQFVITDTGNVGIGTTSPGYKLQVGNFGDGTSAVANAWNTFSSIRWKRDIKPIDNPLDKIKKITGVYFYWKESGKRDIGLIAEDVGKVIPEVVTYEENGKDAKSLDYSKLTSVLIEAIKEQQKQIEELKKEIEMMKQ